VEWRKGFFIGSTRFLNQFFIFVTYDKGRTLGIDSNIAVRKE